ncbi:hypothetical protein [Myxococcus sp. SDU36]|uniref:hypothetical protein n=1 Tax=Myxococcus sp. SDU36 TaxID=2831967 RepID=UPI002542C270|nr:hypothetical protein [Myxococcus sp. SDU36]WIG97070.1 hypothetical protein KGD87_06605 [Myxococcus sp. SDU36]
MKRFTLLLLCTLSAVGCSFAPKSWRLHGFASPPGVPSDAWDVCANSMLSDTGRIITGPAHEAGFQQMKPFEQDCMRAEYLRACLSDAYQLERAQGLRLRPNAVSWSADWRDVLDDAVDKYCDDEGGDTSGARGLVRVLNEKAEENGRRCVPCTTH